ncbi:MAG: hypothetical protein AAF725_26725 [Acidobacteriota bacterium]
MADQSSLENEPAQAIEFLEDDELDDVAGGGCWSLWSCCEGYVEPSSEAEEDGGSGPGPSLDE